MEHENIGLSPAWKSAQYSAFIIFTPKLPL